MNTMNTENTMSTMSTMNTIVLKGEAVDLLRIAQSARAKGDVRHYLNGVLFDFQGKPGELETPEKAWVVGTDGHALARGKIHLYDKIEGPDLQEIILDIDQGRLIPANVHRIVFQVWTGENLKTPGSAVYYKDGGNILKTVTVSVVDGRYPDWREVLGKEYGYTSTRSVSFNPHLVAKLAKAAGSTVEGCRLTFQKNFADLSEAVNHIKSAIKIEVSTLGTADYRMIIMPIRWGSEK